MNCNICVSIGENTVEGCIGALEGLEFAEIRLDKIAELDDNGVRKIFTQPLKLMATCRPDSGIPDETRKRLLGKAIESGADYVDIEVDAKEDYKQELVNKAKKKGCKVIISFHDYKRTPQKTELEHLLNWCLESGADVVKIACKINSAGDNARLLGLLDSDKNIIVIGMGEKGKITRIIAPLLGSPFTFASLADGKETGEGQIEKEKIERILKMLGESK